MAKLYFRYGAMGSSKTANAIMVQYNYQERGQDALMIKPQLDSRDGEREVASRSGLKTRCNFIEEIDSIDLSAYNCIIVDEAQFLTKAQVAKLVEIADGRNIPVICYGLRADFQGNLFEGSTWLMAWADTIEEIKTVCWCGRKATCNARVVNGKVAREGEQIVLGGNESYVALCRRHWRNGELAPVEVKKISAGKKAYLDLLLEADPSEAMIDRYLEDSDMYVLSANGTPVSVAVIGRGEDGCLELFNLATERGARNKGYAKELVRHLMRLYKPQSDVLRVGTSRGQMPFYEKLGFKHVGTREGFFENENYALSEFDEPGLKDMEVLEIKL